MKKELLIALFFSLCLSQSAMAGDSSAAAMPDLSNSTPEEISKIPCETIAALSPESIETIAYHMTDDQVKAIPPTTIKQLSSGFLTEFIGSTLSKKQIGAIPPRKIARLPAASIAEINGEDLNPDQVSAILPETLAELPPENIAELDTLSLRPEQIKAIPAQTFKELPKQTIEHLAKNATPLQLAQSNYADSFSSPNLETVIGASFGAPQPADDSSSRRTK